MMQNTITILVLSPPVARPVPPLIARPSSAAHLPSRSLLEQSQLVFQFRDTQPHGVAAAVVVEAIGQRRAAGTGPGLARDRSADAVVVAKVEGVGRLIRRQQRLVQFLARPPACDARLPRPTHR